MSQFTTLFLSFMPVQIAHPLRGLRPARTPQASTICATWEWLLKPQAEGITARNEMDIALRSARVEVQQSSADLCHELSSVDFTS